MSEPLAHTSGWVAPPSCQLSRIGGATRVWQLVGAMVLVAGLLEAEVLHGLRAVGHRGLPWWGLAAFFYLAEANVVHLHFRREAHTLSLNEIPIVIGLFFTGPEQLLLAMVLGAAVALFVHRRQRAIKLAFNIAQFAVGASLAIVAFHLVAGSGVQTDQPRAWIGAFLAVMVSAVTSSVLVTLAIFLAEGRNTLQGVPRVAQVALLNAVANASLALLAVDIAHHDPAALVLLLVPGVTAALAFLAYARQRQRHQHIEVLYKTMQAAHTAQELEAAVRELLVSARQIFRSDLAELVLDMPDRKQLAQSVISSQGERLLQPTTLAAEERKVLDDVSAKRETLLLPRTRPGKTPHTYLAARGFKDAMVAPLHGENGVIGTLTVANCASDVSTFTSDDKKLFEAFLAHAALAHAAVLLENDRLEQSIIELTKLKEQLHHQAHHDALTGLPNRRLILELANTDLDEAKLCSSTVGPALLFLDLDDFKTINDSLGHAAGDQLLVSVGKRLQESIRPQDTAARLGGDEFALLLKETSADEAEAVTESVLRRLDLPFRIAGRRVSVHAAVGIAITNPDVQSANDLLRNADLAMYTAKQSGNQRYATYRNHMQTRVRQRHELVAALENALGAGEIVAHYQPIIDLTTGRLAALEALARWDRPGYGVLAPKHFLDLAAETGLIVPIGRAVYTSACKQLGLWQAQYTRSDTIAIAFNLSAQEFHEPTLVDDIESLLTQTSLSPRNVIVEITESSAMADFDASLATMGKLRRLGLRLALDDFGTGHSSLSRVCEFPIDLIKIGTPFVDRLDTGIEEPLSQAVFRFANSLPLRIVAEGIETEEQLKALRTLGCSLGQGYYFARPLDANTVEAVIRTHTVTPTLHAVA